MNEVLENIKTRRSYRSFTNKAISKEDLSVIMEAAIYSPTAMNKQSWQFSVLQNDAKIAELAAAIGTAVGRENYNFYKPNVMILISNDKENTNAFADTGCAMQNIMLASHSIGIASVWINQIKGQCDVTEIRALLDAYGIPKNHDVFACCALGYSDDTPKEIPRNLAAIKYVD